MIINNSLDNNESIKENLKDNNDKIKIAYSTSSSSDENINQHKEITWVSLLKSLSKVNSKYFINYFKYIL